MSAIAPMEALLAEQLPDGPGWQYEPKWDGFRCIAVRDGGEVELWSKSGKPLARYFPEIAAMFGRLKAKRFVIDGELLIVSGGAIVVRRAAASPPSRRKPGRASWPPKRRRCSWPSIAWPSGKQMLAREASAPNAARSSSRCWRRRASRRCCFRPRPTDRDRALGWLERTGGALDGVIAKRLDQPYRPGERAMVKVKQRRTADCVVGGFRYGRNDRWSPRCCSASMTMPACSTMSASPPRSPPRTARPGPSELEKLIEPPGFTGNAPGGPSRWATERTAEWQPLKPKIVVEVLYDQVTAGRFRHGTKLLRRRPDKAPRQCTWTSWRIR